VIFGVVLLLLLGGSHFIIALGIKGWEPKWYFEKVSCMQFSIEVRTGPLVFMVRIGLA
jgi:hypothetical protein